MLEAQCIQALQQGGSLAPPALRKRVAYMPAYVRSGGRKVTQAFAAFLASRPHLFIVTVTGPGKRVAAAPGRVALLAAVVATLWAALIQLARVHAPPYPTSPRLHARLELRCRRGGVSAVQAPAAGVLGGAAVVPRADQACQGCQVTPSSERLNARWSVLPQLSLLRHPLHPPPALPAARCKRLAAAPLAWRLGWSVRPAPATLASWRTTSRNACMWTAAGWSCARSLCEHAGQCIVYALPSQVHGQEPNAGRAWCMPLSWCRLGGADGC